LYSQGKLDEAEAEFRKAIEINPTRANFHNNLGKLLADRGKLEEAKAEYEEAIRLNPKGTGAYYTTLMATIRKLRRLIRL